MYEDFICLQGPKDGPISVVVVGTHGDERCGIEALQEILPTLEITAGTVFFAYGNPRAIEQNVRFTEANLNRLFKDDVELTSEQKNSYEYTRAQELKKLFDQSSAVLDIHASTTPESQPFLICESNGFEIGRALPFDIIVSGFDNTQPGGTDHYMNANGNIGLAPECGYLADPLSKMVARETILSFLAVRGHIKCTPPTHAIKTFISVYEMYISKADGFRLAKKFKDFEKISVGETIGFDGPETVVAKQDSVIIFPNENIPAGGEAFLLGKI